MRILLHIIFILLLLTSPVYAVDVKTPPPTIETEVYDYLFHTRDTLKSILDYGEIYYMGAGFNTVLAAQDTYYQILGFDSNGDSENATPDHTQGHITVNRRGKYLINFSVSAKSAAANDYQFMVKYNNGTSDCTNIMIHRTTSVANRLATGACSGICDLPKNATVELWVQRTDGGAVAKTITIEHVNLSVILLGVL